MSDFAAGEMNRGFLPRHIPIEAGIGGAGARYPLVLKESERPRAHGIGDLFGARFQSKALRHDKRLPGAESEQELRAHLLQADFEFPVVYGDDLVDIFHQHLAEGVARTPAAQRLGAVLGQHLLAIVEFQPLAQGEGPGELVG
jgi:hypothetical protein